MTSQPLQEPGPDSQVDERRGSRRTPLMLTAWIWRAAPREGMGVRLMNYSEEGIGFISSVALEKGEIVELSLDHAGVRRTALKVTHCEFFNDNAFRVGAQAMIKTEGEMDYSQVIG